MKLYKQKKYIKIKNINDSYKDRFRIRYNFCGVKLTIKNKEKVNIEKVKEVFI